MICRTCHGTGRMRTGHNARVTEPCIECNGFGVTHCCEGDQAQPSCESVSPPRLSASADLPKDHLDPTS